MKEMIETMRKSYIKRLARMITAKGSSCTEDLEDVLDKMDALALEIIRYDEKTLMLPLEIKRMVAFIISPSHYITYDTKRDGDYLTVTASLFWTPNDLLPAGVGFVRSNINNFGSYDWTTSPETKECQFEAALRGSAATRAYYDAGIGLGFGDELPDPEVVEKKKSGTDLDKIPDPQAAKGGKRSKKTTRQPETTTEETDNDSSTNQENESKDTRKPGAYSPAEGEAADPTNAAKEDINGSVKKGTTSLEGAPANMAPSYTLEEALNTRADMGAYKGYTLGEILESKPKGLIWLFNKNSAVKEQVLTVIKSDPEVYSLFCENRSNM